MSEPATDAPTPQQALALPMQQPNDANAATIRDYLVKLLARLWEEGECFSGKRPLGNSCWEWDLFIPLVRAGFIAGKFETYDGKETGGLNECDDAAGTALIAAAIQALGQPDEQPQDDGDVRAVRAVVDAAGKLPIPQYEAMPELASALNALLERFEDRIKVIDEAESLARLRARMAADYGNRTPLAEVLRAHGMTEADLDARDVKGGGEQ